jgi:hypothetical protein
MYRTVVLWLCLLLAPIGTSMARDSKPAHSKQEAKAPKAKELSGMSIVGNDEAPKALYIVPWKSSEIGGETDLNMDLNAADKPVDRDVFMRQLDFYELSTKQ